VPNGQHFWLARRKFSLTFACSHNLCLSSPSFSKGIHVYLPLVKPISLGLPLADAQIAVTTKAYCHSLVQHMAFGRSPGSRQALLLLLPLLLFLLMLVETTWGG